MLETFQEALPLDFHEHWATCATANWRSLPNFSQVRSYCGATWIWNDWLEPAATMGTGDAITTLAAAPALLSGDSAWRYIQPKFATRLI